MKREQLTKGNEIVDKIEIANKNIKIVNDCKKDIQMSESAFVTLRSTHLTIAIENEIAFKAIDDQIKLYQDEIALLEKELKAL